MSPSSWRLAAEALGAFGARPALEGAAEPLSYQKLAGRAAAVADALGDAGIAPGDPVALVSAGRAHDEAVALCGILLAGAVVVPLDASAPLQRLRSIVDDRGCRAVLHDDGASAMVTALGLDCARVELDPQGFVLASGGVAGARRQPAQPELACILHTSGSTGTPKAVPIGWEHLDVFSAWMIEITSLGASDRVLRVAELVFDLAWFDHIATFRRGATLCTLTRRHMAAGRSLLQQIEQLRPTVIYGVPAMFMKLCDVLGSAQELPPELRVICFAGEVFPPRELARLARLAPRAELYNLFGPTETNVCTYHHVDRARLDGASELPIGIACPYAECRLVDEAGGVVEGPGTGELVVRGPTALDGEFATRDRVERRGDGLYYFRGRIDRMVKIRGYRVEPAEVEAALVAHPGVREVAVVIVDHPKLGKRLRAYVVARDPRPEERALRRHLADRLPPYMVPDEVVLLESLIRTTTGKIDYQALTTVS
jgi:acyl-CoA synthetase (AMP-forming)/AMP-acid ligase II